jgi:GC-rich sequence DNA-binding factor
VPGNIASSTGWLKYHSLVPPATPIPTLGPVMERITKSLNDLTISHAQTTSALASISEERVQVEARQVNLRATIANAEAKRSWFAAFREWVETVATFLDEKVDFSCSASAEFCSH